MSDRDRMREQVWVFRPAGDRPADMLALSGKKIYAVEAMERDGRAAVVLDDGTHLRASTSEIVAE
jgi:hypothetical protein